MWEYTPIISTLRKWRQENLELSHPQLHSKFEANLGYMRPCLKKKEIKKKKNQDTKEKLHDFSPSSLNRHIFLCLKRKDLGQMEP